MSVALPSFTLLDEAYQTMMVDSATAFATAGVQPFPNACCIRMSHAFNLIPGHEIPRNPSGVAGRVLSGNSGYYILGSPGMARYLASTYGEPIKKSPSDFRSEYRNRVGICFFDVRVWSDAYGHIALWNGRNCYYNEYFSKAEEIWFWETQQNWVAS